MTIGGVGASEVHFVSATELTAKTPAGSGAQEVVRHKRRRQLDRRAQIHLRCPAERRKHQPQQRTQAGGTPVTIKGQGFQPTSTVTIGGVGASEVHFVSATELTAKTPPGSGAQEVVVTSEGASSTGGPKYTYVAPPSVESISPSKGPQAGGTPVTIKGQGFQPTSTVTIGGVGASEVHFVSATELTAKTPPGSGAQEVVVTSEGASSTGGPKYTYVAPPSVESISPSKGPQAGGTPVTIKGQGFQPTSTVTIGGVGASEVHFVSATELTAKTPPGSGAQEVVVTSEGASSTGGPKYTYIPAPTVASVEPNEGSTSAGTPVTINGTNLTGVTKVSFGGSPATGLKEEGPTKITAISPGGTGTIHVQVTTAGGTSETSSADEYTYDPKPEIGQLSVSEGSPEGGTIVHIIGSGFTRSSTVSFGSTPAMSVTYVSPNELTAVAPPASARPMCASHRQAVRAPTAPPTRSPMPRRAPRQPPAVQLDGGGGTSPGPTAKSGVLGSQAAAAPAPVLAVSGNVAPVSGAVLVRLPGTSDFVPLSSVRQIPFGTVIDATNGWVRVTTAAPHGGTQTGEFFSGEFILTQGRNGLVVAKLAGGTSLSARAPAPGQPEGRARRFRPFLGQARGAQTVGQRPRELLDAGQLRGRCGAGHRVADRGSLRRHPHTSDARPGSRHQSGHPSPRRGADGAQLLGQSAWGRALTAFRSGERRWAVVRAVRP